MSNCANEQMEYRPKDRDIAFSLSTRVSAEVMAVLEAEVARRGGRGAQRAAVEDAIMLAYGPEDDAEDEAVQLQRQAESKAAYLTAVNELFRLLGLPASEKSENHRELVAAANNACGAARVLMLEAWEGEDEPWQR